MQNKIIIVGPGGSGKDYLRKKFETKGFSFGVLHTSRPQRKEEEEGRDYFFRNRDFFLDNKEMFVQVQIFNDWFYGLSREEFIMKDLFILSPAGLTGLSDEDKTNSLVIYLNPPAELRRQRLSARSDADTVDRRISADERDFSAFSEYDIMITNIF